MVHFFSKKQKSTLSKKREWGTEKRMTPLPMLHKRPSLFSIAMSRIAIVLTIIFWAIYIVYTIIRQLIDGPQDFYFTMEAFWYSLVVSFLTFSALMYLIARQGALQRFSNHVRVPRFILDKYFAKNKPTITVLVPSYSEEPDVIRKTLFSAALQEYPDLRIVLLLDDNPNPSSVADVNRLAKTKAIVTEITALLSAPATRFKKLLKAFEKKYNKKKSVSVTSVHELVNEYQWAAKWLQTMAKKETITDHVDVFFNEQVLRELANDFELVSKALTMSAKDGSAISKDRMHQLYRRLVWIFSSSVEVFERKKFISLSQEANKAMNLNAYIGLMGGNYRKEQTPDGDILVPVEKKRFGDLSIPDSDFILTLDADSILLREYCLRLVYFLQQPDNARVAVTQTPYSSFRGAYSRIERLAGATTDIQHILHQGFSQYDATFWVGANAVIRKKALEDIVQKDWVGGFEVKRYIQDRTVIEDTESSIDLIRKGWTLVNYPERLSYSATPPDFGSLIVQRRRWANGGLLILPKLWAYIREQKHRGQLISRTEILLRLNYMASIAWSTFGLMFLLAYPYDGRLLSPLVLLAALPYFIAMAID
ncbi:MAG TPA: glycosyltransferase family 2 protein, partial [Patescibacteria group bacterium]|nr:glycosyltransferase family 2 protein [Patescibacteria group bacterium]